MQHEYTDTTALAKILYEYNTKSVFLVTGKRSYQSCGGQAKLHPLLARYQVEVFNDFTVNPKIEDIKRGINVFRKSNCDVVVAIGGGSALDVAKSINILGVHKNNPELYITKNLELTIKGKPLVAIPTTSGTGSEATHFAVVYIDKTKYSLAHPTHMLAEHVILDASLTLSLPPYITACCGMDAFCQAMEAYWSQQTTESAQQYASEAINLIFENIVQAVKAPNPRNRQALLRAANLAGKAINIAKTTACHAISYPLTSYYGIPHGHAVALTIAEIFEYNAQLPKGSTGRKNMDSLLCLLKVDTVKRAKKKIEDLLDAIDLERKLSKFGITTSQNIDLIIENGFNPERMKNNPREITSEALHEILKKLS